MYQHFERGACDPHAPYRPAFYGTFELSVPVGGKTRRMLAYVPKEVRESTAGVFVLGENGCTACWPKAAGEKSPIRRNAKKS